ncbi:MAG: hypothetical protein HC911_18260, partial [Chloroflexaceae bacterium]|nr:hypothetical protein [Chloroflexaceae bacterium]
ATLLPASPPPMAEQPSTAHRTEIAPVVAQAIALLHQHPTLAASVIELIEMMAEAADDLDDAPSTAAD